MKGEATYDYIKAVDALAAVYAGMEKAPLVITTDVERGIKAACYHYWPQTRQIICAWHMNANILA